jgi:hypothetical protein
LQVSEPTYVDVQAALTKSSSLQTDIKSTFKIGSLIGAAVVGFQMLFWEWLLWFNQVRLPAVHQG